MLYTFLSIYTPRIISEETIYCPSGNIKNKACDFSTLLTCYHRDMGVFSRDISLELYFLVSCSHFVCRAKNTRAKYTEV